MKFLYRSILVAALGISSPLLGQVGINSVSPDPSSVLDLTSTDKGLLIPRLTTGQRQAITGPAASLLVFDTTDGRYYFYTGTQWHALNEWTRVAGSNNVIHNGNVGIGSANAPGSSSVLDISSTDKGLLIPRLTTAQRQAINAPAVSLLVFDTTDGRYYFYTGTQWHTLNEWTRVAGSNNITHNGNVGIGTTNPRGKFDVDGTGDIYLSDDPATGTTQSIYLPGHIFVSPYNGTNVSYVQARRQGDAGTTEMQFRTTNNGVMTDALKIDGAGNIAVGKPNAQYKVDVNGVVNATGLYINGAPLSIPAAIPTGGIIMWSGSIASIPAGWVLCNGASGTPDLRDRFIVGAGNSYSPGAVGGSTTVALTTNELPSHSHTGSTSTVSDHGHTGSTGPNGNHAHTGTTNTDGSHPHSGATNIDGSHAHIINGETMQKDGTGTKQVKVLDTGLDPNAGNYTEPTATDGVHQHSFSISSSGAHAHAFTTSTVGEHSHAVQVTPGGAHAHSFSTTSVGSGAAFDNRPLYYSLAYIMKLP